jgi:chromosome partitioning protein
MPTVVFANPKGGSSKSTSCLVLATMLATTGRTVAILDTDRNQPIVDWRTGKSQSPVRVIGNKDVDEDSIVRVIEAERKRHEYVFVDTEGSASLLVSRAILRADFVLVPLQASAVDARQASRAVALVRREEEVISRTIPFQVLLTRTSPLIQTGLEKEIAGVMAKAKLPTFKTHLHERQAFKLMFARRLALDELGVGKVSGLDKAIANAKALAEEFIQMANTKEPTHV